MCVNAAKFKKSRDKIVALNMEMDKVSVCMKTMSWTNIKLLNGNCGSKGAHP